MDTLTDHLHYAMDGLYTHALNNFNAKGLFGLVTVSIIVYACVVAIYNLYFSPLAAFPDPKIAAATGYYEFYYDFFKKGKYIFEIEMMHKKYGSLTRHPHRTIVPVGWLDLKRCPYRSYSSGQSPRTVYPRSRIL